MRNLRSAGLLVPLTCLALAPSAAALQDPAASTAGHRDFSYTYGQVALMRVDFDGVDDESDGIEFSGSYALDEKLYLWGGLGFASGDVDVTALALGVGYHQPLAPTVDLVAEFGLLHSEFDFSGGDDDETGWQLGGGVRAWVAQQVEVDAQLVYVDLGDSDIGLDLGARYYLDTNLSFGLGLFLIDDADTLSINARWDF